jgi:hypothetical protein
MPNALYLPAEIVGDHLAGRNRVPRKSIVDCDRDTNLLVMKALLEGHLERRIASDMARDESVTDIDIRSMRG